MSFVSQPASYTQVTQAAEAQPKIGVGELVGAIVISSTAGTLTVYDNASAASGTQLLALTGLTAGQIIHFGGAGIICKLGLHVVVGGTATVNLLWR